MIYDKFDIDECVCAS